MVGRFLTLFLHFEQSEQDMICVTYKSEENSKNMCVESIGLFWVMHYIGVQILFFKGLWVSKDAEYNVDFTNIILY
jgi:hypothetical protein